MRLVCCHRCAAESCAAIVVRSMRWSQVCRSYSADPAASIAIGVLPVLAALPRRDRITAVAPSHGMSQS